MEVCLIDQTCTPHMSLDKMPLHAVVMTSTGALTNSSIIILISVRKQEVSAFNQVNDQTKQAFYRDKYYNMKDEQDDEEKDCEDNVEFVSYYQKM